MLPHLTASSVPRLLAAALLVACLALPANVAGADGPFDYFTVTPCRVFDTREVATQTNGNPLPNPGPHSFRIKGNCSIPNGAEAVSGNVTIVSPSRDGDLRMAPVGVAFPLVSTLNYRGGTSALANGIIVPLASVGGPNDDDLQLQIGMTGPGTVHVLFDVTGYFD